MSATLHRSEAVHWILLQPLSKATHSRLKRPITHFCIFTTLSGGSGVGLRSFTPFCSSPPPFRGSLWYCLFFFHQFPLFFLFCHDGDSFSGLFFFSSLTSLAGLLSFSGGMILTLSLNFTFDSDPLLGLFLPPDGVTEGSLLGDPPPPSPYLFLVFVMADFNFSIRSSTFEAWSFSPERSANFDRP